MIEKNYFTKNISAVSLGKFLQVVAVVTLLSACSSKSGTKSIASSSAETTSSSGSTSSTSSTSSSSGSTSSTSSSSGSTSSTSSSSGSSSGSIPSGESISINSAAQYSTSLTVTLTLSATDATSMYITEDSNCSGGGTSEAYGVSKSFTLSAGEGARSVYVKFTNATGDTACTSDSIIIDTVAPSAPSSLNTSELFSSATQSPNLSWTAGTDAGSGISLHEVKIIDSASGVVVNWGTATSGSSISLSSYSPDKYKFIVRAKDNAGNISSEATLSSTWVVCPANYIFVPSLSPFTSVGFCAMKWEAKYDGSKAVSQSSGMPDVNVTRSTAEARCQAQTPSGKFDLISNGEWMSIARNAEVIASNWSSGVVGTGMLYPGNQHWSTSVVCDGQYEYGGYSPDNSSPEQTCSASSNSYSRRTYTLSNNEVIWDMNANVKEFVKTSVVTPLGGNAFVDGNVAGLVSSVNFETSDGLSGNYMTLFGSTVDTTSCNNSDDDYCGFGLANMSWVDTLNVLTRGGEAGSGSSWSVFSTEAWRDTSTAEATLGYRCVFHP